MKMDRRTLSLPVDLANKIRKMAAIDRRPINTQIIVLLERAVSEREAKIKHGLGR